MDLRQPSAAASRVHWRRSAPRLVEETSEAARRRVAAAPAWVVQTTFDVLGVEPLISIGSYHLLLRQFSYTAYGWRSVLRVRRGKPWAAASTGHRYASPGDQRTQSSIVSFAVSSRSRRQGGTGLGLSIVAAMCAAITGQISVASSVGFRKVFSGEAPIAWLKHKSETFSPDQGGVNRPCAWRA